MYNLILWLWHCLGFTALYYPGVVVLSKCQKNWLNPEKLLRWFLPRENKQFLHHKIQGWPLSCMFVCHMFQIRVRRWSVRPHRSASWTSTASRCVAAACCVPSRLPRSVAATDRHTTMSASCESRHARHANNCVFSSGESAAQVRKYIYLCVYVCGVCVCVCFSDVCMLVCIPVFELVHVSSHAKIYNVVNVFYVRLLGQPIAVIIFS